ncbi:MAG: adenosylcobinamide-phosphate synthase CbiB [Coriobacteriia bacterium]|nr:adenosylcobinamide-phosphate synthase CbiB [Coriobacteriia bacterium]
MLASSAYPLLTWLSVALLARAASLALALVLDLAFGDLPSAWHPVAWLGRSITALERTIRRAPSLDGLAGGALLAAMTATLAVGPALALSWSPRLGALATTAVPVGTMPAGATSAASVAFIATTTVATTTATAVDALLIWLTLAARSLAEEGRTVSAHLAAGDLPAARGHLSHLVARRTDVLDESGVARATIESMGENVVDGVIAPMFWAALLGPGGAWLHKAASTLDSMVGYKNERYATFGTVSARLDDALAWVPARLALMVVPVAGACIGLDARGAWRTALSDRHKHASPNSAHGEAAFAGALGVSLGGCAMYADHVTERPVIAEGFPDPSAADAVAAARLVVACAAVTATFAVGVALILAVLACGCRFLF